MNTNGLVKRYHTLTPEERFRLILSAGGRGDDAERDRLIMAGKKLSLSVQDHAPFAHAFNELAQHVYLELLEGTHRYLDAFDRAYPRSTTRKEGVQQAPDGSGDETRTEAEAEAASGGIDARRNKQPVEEQYFELTLAFGFVLRTKAEGWKLFCGRLNVPPFALWQGLPGYERLRGALDSAEKAAFVAEGFLRWLNDIRPSGCPKLSRVPLTAEGIAAATEAAFRQRIQWWSG